MASPLPGTLSNTHPDGAVHVGSSYSDEFLRSFTSLSQVDAAISPLLAQVASLRTRRNELLAISKLPPEILVQILALSNSENKHKHIDMSWPYPHYRPTWVCRAWRDIAFSTPSLWTYIQGHSSIADVHKFLDLSKTLPLDVYIHLPKIAPTTICTILSEMSRVRMLKLATDLEVDGNLIASLTLPAPLLEDAHIGSRAARFLFPLPEYLFDQQSPRLRRLSLEGCTIHRTTLVAPGIVEHVHHLSLYSCNFVERTFLRPLRAVLEQMHNLKTLEVRMDEEEEENPILFAELERDAVKADLRRLESLAVQGSVPDVLLILEHLQLSDTIRLDIQVFYVQDAEQLSPFAPILADHMPGGPSAVQHLVVDGRKGRGAAWHDTQLTICVSAGGHSSPTISLTFWPPEWQSFDMDMLLPTLCAPIPLASLRTIAIYDLERTSSLTLYRTFGNANGVTSLILRGTDVVMNTVHMLMDQLMEDRLLFPTLEQLTLEEASFQIGICDSISGILCGILVERYERLAVPIPLCVNVIKARGINANALRALSNAVGEAAEIIWDSSEYDDSDT